MTNAAKMLALLESCPSCADVLALYSDALESMFADSDELPPEYTAAQEALQAAIRAVSALDES